ncbi:MAG TPA: cyclic nucleotide-binding domain-containing protein [Myxococcaceae bacterium]|nr:cyclic nucleotide-binding domain-containing protein [Myxococcaceae bacterium]
MRQRHAAAEDSGPVIRVGLKRVNLDERVLGDAELRGCAFARLIGDHSLRVLLSEANGRRFADGARIFLQADPGDSLVLLLKGEARLTQGAGAQSVDVAVVRKGELMGEREVAGESATRSYTATALGEVELVEFPRSVVQSLAREHAGLARHLREIGEARKTAGAEMTDFLNRW